MQAKYAVLLAIGGVALGAAGSSMMTSVLLRAYSADAQITDCLCDAWLPFFGRPRPQSRLGANGGIRDQGRMHGRRRRGM